MTKHNGYIVKETQPGHLDITCEVSGKPFIKANKHGMFCGDDCECEKKFKEVFGFFDLFINVSEKHR